jgi:hypothetical protein
VVGFDACGAGPCLYAVRNVLGASGAVAPQLWRCVPSAVPAACAPGDWSLVAPDAADPLSTRIGSAGHGAASLLLATPGWLYVGFDDGATGIQLYRAARGPGAASDFQGRAGCAAGTAGCEGLGGNGFGLAGLTRIFGATVLEADGASSVWIAAGDGEGPVRIFRLDDPAGP